MSSDSGSSCGGCIVLIALFFVISGAAKSCNENSNTGYPVYTSTDEPAYQPQVFYDSQKVQAFQEEQEHTVTPYGRIDVSSVYESSDGRIHYETTDGSSWIVEMSADSDGRYQYSEPIRSE